MNGVAEFLDMGGRAAFVWPAYGFTLLVLIGILVVAIRGLRSRERELERFEGRPRREPRK
ncbi:MAG TPA: heme exporter protein CcmD [Alphaproteobacteria bacterium]|nr:heme exporter protein CcmD [Alphaproteobacteria bacterium]